LNFELEPLSATEEIALSGSACVFHERDDHRSFRGPHDLAVRVIDA
jgi:hypothetical protein